MEKTISSQEFNNMLEKLDDKYKEMNTNICNIKSNIDKKLLVIEHESEYFNYYFSLFSSLLSTSFSTLSSTLSSTSSINFEFQVNIPAISVTIEISVEMRIESIIVPIDTQTHEQDNVAIHLTNK